MPKKKIKRKAKRTHASHALAYSFSFFLLFLLLLFLTQGQFLQSLRGQLLPRATLKILPSQSTQTVGQDFTLDIVLDTGGQAIGGVLVDLTYTNLAFVKADALGAVFDQQVLVPSPLRNHLQFAALRFDGGYSGAEGQLHRLTFKPLSPGVATVTIVEEISEVIAFEDSSNALNAVMNASFTVTGDAALPATCGNGACESTETCSGCALDCGCLANETCNAAANTCSAKQTSTTYYGSPPENDDPLCLVTISEGEILPSDAGKLLLTVSGLATVFRDVPIDQWFSRYIATVIRSGIASGYKDASGKLTGYFGPANAVTYAEIAKMSLEIAGEKAFLAAGKPANSSAIGQWSEGYIRLAEDKNLSVYAPSLNVNAAASRGAVIQTILEAMDIPIVFYKQNPFTDFSLNHPHAAAILTATTLGIVRGDTDAQGKTLLRFRPDDPVNRAEVAKILSETGKIGCEDTVY